MCAYHLVIIVFVAPKKFLSLPKQLYLRLYADLSVGMDGQVSGFAKHPTAGVFQAGVENGVGGLGI